MKTKNKKTYRTLCGIACTRHELNYKYPCFNCNKSLQRLNGKYIAFTINDSEDTYYYNAKFHLSCIDDFLDLLEVHEDSNEEIELEHDLELTY